MDISSNSNSSSFFSPSPPVAFTVPASPPADKPYHSKRPHKKSRNGCTNCKTRKVKCDEVRPACRSCRLRSADCVYVAKGRPSPSSPDSPVVVTKTRSPVKPTPEGMTVVSVSPQVKPYCLEVDELDMKLMMWYITNTYTSFMTHGERSSALESVLKIQVPQLAFHHPFLMNGILGLTSIHLQNCGQSVPKLRALTYQTKAFSGYREAVNNSDPSTYPALLACSLLICGLSSEYFRDPDAPPLFILQWMLIWRGIGTIVDLTKPKILLESGLQVLFFRPKINLDETTHYIPNNLLFMIDSIGSDEDDYRFKAAYYDTLKYLGSIYDELETSGFNPIFDLRVMSFFTFLPQTFVDLARTKRPRALVILAYYLMFNPLVKSIWWIKGIHPRGIREIVELLGPEWEHMLVAPISVMRASDSLEIAKLILGKSGWKPPKGEGFNPNDERVQELSWVDDRGRQVILETGQVIHPQPKSPTIMQAMEPTTPDEDPVWNCPCPSSQTNMPMTLVPTTSEPPMNPDVFMHDDDWVSGPAFFVQSPTKHKP